MKNKCHKIPSNRGILRFYIDKNTYLAPEILILVVNVLECAKIEYNDVTRPFLSFLIFLQGRIIGNLLYTELIWNYKCLFSFFFLSLQEEPESSNQQSAAEGMNFNFLHLIFGGLDFHLPTSVAKMGMLKYAYRIRLA